MSANNFLLIRKTKEDKYLVQHCDADIGDQLENLGLQDSLEKAVEVANNFMDKEEVEYGLQIDIKK